jgi:hypothetical protein
VLGVRPAAGGRGWSSACGAHARGSIDWHRPGSGGGACCVQGGKKRGGGSGWGRPTCGPARSGAHLKVMQGFNEWVRPEKQLKFKFDFQIESKLIHLKMNLPKLENFEIKYGFEGIKEGNNFLLRNFL